MVVPGFLTNLVCVTGAAVAELLKALEIIEEGAADVYQYRGLVDDVVRMIPQSWYDGCKEAVHNTASYCKEKAERFRGWMRSLMSNQ